MNEAPLLTTERLVLRPHARADLAALHHLWSLEPVYRFGRGKPPTEEESWHRLLRYGGMWPLLGIGFWAMQHRTSGRYIGEAGFADFHRGLDASFGDYPEAGWMLDPDYWKQGYAAEALTAIFNWFDRSPQAGRSVCMITQGNEASVRIAEKFGFAVYDTATYSGSTVDLLKRLTNKP